MKQKIDDYGVVIADIVVAHKWVFKPHAVYDCSDGRKRHGLVHLLTGELEYRFSDGRYLFAQAGDFILLKPSDGYVVSCSGECKHYTVNFELLPSSVSGEVASGIFLSDEIAVIRQGEARGSLADVLDRLCEIWQQKEPGYRMQALSLLYKLLDGFIRLKLPSYQSARHARLKPAVDLLETAWNQDLSLKLLADACNLSVAHFRHLFTKVFEISPMEYRDSLRLLYAKDYLMRKDLSVTEVACKCGFSDTNYFCRFFKKHTGSTPARYSANQLV